MNPKDYSLPCKLNMTQTSRFTDSETAGFSIVCQNQKRKESQYDKTILKNSECVSRRSDGHVHPAGVGVRRLLPQLHEGVHHRK